SRDDRSRLRWQHELVRAAVLAALARQRPDPALVELGPAHLRDLVATRAGEHEHPQRLPEWLAVLAGEPQPAQLGVGEGALAYLLLMRLLEPGDRRERERVARDQPVEELRQRPECPVGQITAAADGHALDQIDHVALADAGDRATAARAAASESPPSPARPRVFLPVLPCRQNRNAQERVPLGCTTR